MAECNEQERATSNHANEYVARRVEGLDRRRFHGELHQPRYAGHNHLHQTPVVEDIDDGAEVDDDGKYLQEHVRNVHFLDKQTITAIQMSRARSSAIAEKPRDALRQLVHAMLHEVWQLERFKSAKVTFNPQGHWHWCHSIRRIRFSISLPLQLCLYLAPLTRYYHLFPKTYTVHVKTLS